MKMLVLNSRKGIRRTTLVDDSDFEKLSAFKVYASARGKYACVTLNEGCGAYRMIELHRFVLGLHRGDGKVVDHINGNPLDNRKENLRLVQHRQNSANRKPDRDGACPFKGVSESPKRPFRKKPWRARIAGRWIGNFETAEAAARAYDDAARTEYGPFAALNFPLEGENSCRRAA